MATACIAALSKQRFWMHSKREQWAEHVQAWRVNGLSQVAWCREQGLSLASFGYWRRRLAKGPVAPAGSCRCACSRLPRRIRLPPCSCTWPAGCGCRWCRSIGNPPAD
ncbi:IS66 family insertion sequence element accessory protein TnpA [Xanthomonas euvesicatoria]